MRMGIKEEWKSVVGYEGWYEISNLGRVKRVKAGMGAVVGKILKPHPDPAGYINAVLHQDNHACTFHCHQLVAKAFIGTCPVGREVNHLDGVKTNNSVDNLEYVTRKENGQHASRMGLLKPVRGERQPNAKLTERDVHIIRGLLGKRFQAVIAERFGVTQSTISDIATGKKWAWLREGVV